MGYETAIQWCHHTWNPWRGCWKISEGCAHCYAEKGSRQNPKVLGTWGMGSRRAIAAETYWRLPSRWNQEAAAAGERRRVFCLSLGDWLELHDDLDAPRARLLGTIAATPHLDWLLLTKRPESWEQAIFRAGNVAAIAGDKVAALLAADWLDGSPPANVWAGASVENQARFDERLDMTRSIPAPVHFLSAEPLLGPISMPGVTGIDWVIIGGESGPEARPCDIHWIASLAIECRAAGISPFVKQLGANVEAMDVDSVHPWDDFPGTPKLTRGSLGPHMTRVHLRHPKGGDPDEWPPALNVRQFPR